MRLLPNLLPTLGIVACLLAMVGVVLFTNDYYVFIVASMALCTIVAIGLNILIGWTGQVSFGHVGFYAIGAYTVAILTTTYQLPFVVALLIGVLLSGISGALLALPALRASGPYLAMVTIAFGFIIENVAVEWRDVTGGQNGIMGIRSSEAFSSEFGESDIALIAIAIVAILLYASWILSRSNLGRAMRAVKDTELAAASIGLNPVTVKTVAFALSALCAGLAGGFFAPLSDFVTPSTFAFSQSLLFVLIVFIGGAGTVAGPLIGAAVVVLLPEFLSTFAEYRLLFFGVLLLSVLWVAPEGIVGEVSRLLRRRTSVSSAGTGNARSEAGGQNLQPVAPLRVVVDSLAISFGGVKAVNNVSFVAEPGKVTSLIGPNGAGKTTVLNMVSGFYKPKAGSIHVGERDLTNLPAHVVARAGVARTYQTSRLFGSMSVFDNLAIARCKGRLGLSLPGTDAVVRELAAFVGYGGDLECRAADLPHGDRRLIEIARALAARPGVLLLDEPAAGLSSSDKQRLAALLRRIADSGVALIIVEHDMSLVMSVSDHVVVVDAGVRIAAGTPDEVQRNEAVQKAYLGASGSGFPASSTAKVLVRALGEELLNVSQLSTGYGANPVLKDVDLRVRDKEIVAILGANGSGKSTLMRALSGLKRPVSGSIKLRGKEVQDLPAHKLVSHGVALVPEGHQVFPELSVLDNIRLGAYHRGEASKEEVEAMLDRFPRLRERLHQRAGLLSGGEQQMLAIVRGLMSHPHLLLLDEPSLGLAPAIINELFAALAKLREENVSIVLADQMAGLALALADSALVIERGKIVASGSAADIAADDSLRRAYLGA